MAEEMTRYTGPAMTLGNMRENGKRAVLASCACGHEASVNVDALADFVEVPAIRQRVRCSACGARPVDVRNLAYRADRAGLGL